MKKNYLWIVLFLCAIGTILGQETQKNFINYQGVARSADNALMANETMVIGIDLKLGGSAVAPTYSENHSITTDANGVFSLKIGNGDLVSGNYNNFPWGNLATFVTVSINGSEVGTTEMTAVPYALSSGDGAQQADEVPYDNSVSGLAATNTQEAIDELVGSGGVDADADPNNELQLLSFDSGTNELSLSDGNSVVIPSGGTDADADPTNEIQTISFDAASNEISLTNGGTITIPSGGTDADADPTNELQNLSFDAGTNELSLSNGNSVTIPSGGTDADADPLNEIQDIELIGTELTITEGSTIDLADIIPPGGTDDQNATEVPFDNTASGLTATDAQAAIDELATSGLVDTDDQALVLTGDILTIEDGAGSVDLSAYKEEDVTAQSGILVGDGTDVTGLEGTADGQVPKWDNNANAWVAGTDATGGAGSSLWTENGNNIHFATGNVGIGLDDAPASKLQVHTAGVESKTIISSVYTGKSATDGLSLGISGTESFFGFNAKILNNEIGNLELGTNGTIDMVIDREGQIGIGISSPATTLDIAGGQWDLNNTNGDFRIGNNTRGLRIGVATGNGPGGGDVRLRAQGGTNRLFIGAGNEDVMTVTPNNVAVNGDVNITGEVNRPSTGAANMVPIAYGTINSNGTIWSGSGNYTVTNISTGKYIIAIDGEEYNWRDYITMANLNVNFGFVTVFESTTPTAALRVSLWDENGVPENQVFTFVTYKP